MLPTAVGIVHHREEASWDVLSHLGQPDLEFVALELLHRLRTKQMSRSPLTSRLRLIQTRLALLLRCASAIT